MNTPTLSQLADIGAKAARAVILHGYSKYDKEASAREAFVKAVLDAIGYKLPVDPEREAFDAWVKDATCLDGENRLFEAWKAGRDVLRKCLQGEYKMPPSYGGVDLLASATTKPVPETFEAHGHAWFKHTPGDPMPVAGDVKVDVIMREEKAGVHFRSQPLPARLHRWNTAEEEELNTDGTDVVGWRHA